MYKNTRIKQIEADLSTYGFVDVNVLSNKLNVSEMTIRRDLGILAEQGRAVRTRGGAVLPKVHYTGDMDMVSRSLVHSAEKRAIAKEAVKFLSSGDNIFIDDSSTVIYMAQFIPHNIQLTITTTSIIAAAEFNKLSNVEIVCMGGTLNRDTKSVVGALPLEFLQKAHFKTAFLGFPCISYNGDISTNSIDEYSIKKMVIQQSNTSVLLMDSSKIQTNKKFLQPCTVMDFDSIIMDQNIASDFNQFCLKNNVSLITVSV